MDQLAHQAGHFRRVGVLIERATHRHAGAAAGHDVAHFVQHAAPAGVGDRTAQKEHRDATLATTRATAGRRSAPGATAGTGTLITGAPRSWAITAANTIASVSRAHPAVAPQQRLDQGLEPGEARLSKTWPSSSSAGAVRGRPCRSGSCASPPSTRPAARPGHAGHQPVVELEGRAGQAGAVDRQVGAVPRGRWCPTAASAASGCGRGQDRRRTDGRARQRGDEARPSSRWS